MASISSGKSVIDLGIHARRRDIMVFDKAKKERTLIDMLISVDISITFKELEKNRNIHGCGTGNTTIGEDF